MILNLTQHPATAEQVAADVVDVTGFVPGDDAATLRGLLTFEEIPSELRLHSNAMAIAAFAVRRGAKRAMIGGAPFFMAPLERALRDAGVEPVYAFSRRESVEEKQPDGAVRKSAVFRHVGFVSAGQP